MDIIYDFLSFIEEGIWGFVAVPALVFLGLTLTFQSRFVQIRHFPRAFRIFTKCFKPVEKNVNNGVHPIKAFFACFGGCIGVGNIVGICTAVQIGGPGALLWIWLTAIVGSLVKYSEVYLGIKHRIPNSKGGYDGGPMYFLQKAFKGKYIPAAVAVLLCIYGVEVYQFSIVSNVIAANFEINRHLVVVTLLALVLYAGMGGVRRIGSIASVTIPVFVCFYISMSAWVLYHHLDEVPIVLMDVIESAFGKSAAIGGFVGSTIMMTISQGVRRGCYTGDLGVGYASIIHSETSAQVPERQAALVIVDIFLDTFVVCTSSLMLILSTGVWNHDLPASMLVQTALGLHFPYMEYFMPFFLFLLGYATINAYFCAGIKCAQYLHPRHGRTIYFVYAFLVLGGFSLVDSTVAQSVMTIAGGLLLVLNSLGIYKLRREVSFNIEEEPESLLDMGTSGGNQPALSQEF